MDPFSSLKRDKLPNHIAVIMDGNGRWAQQRRRPRVFGHKRGADAVRNIVKAADKWGIKILSLFAFSEENWGRPDTEVAALMSLLQSYLLKERDELNQQNVQLRTMGDLNRLPPKTIATLRETEDMLSANSGLLLNIALSYGGRSDIVNATRNLAKQVKAGTLDPDDIDHKALAANLCTWDIPDPDLLIRTSGEQRISNFMLWQLSYTELYFTDCHWPDFDESEFERALAAFQNRKRRYGLVDPPTPVPKAVAATTEL